MEKAQYLQFAETDFLTENIRGQTNLAKRRVFQSRALQVTSKPTLGATCRQGANGTGLWAQSTAPRAVRTMSPQAASPACEFGTGRCAGRAGPLGRLHGELFTGPAGGFAAQQALSGSPCVRRVW